MIAMILAAGRGKRMRPITDKTPKALIKVNGVSLLERNIKKLVEFGVKKIVINLYWLGEKIVDEIGSGSKYGIQICYSPEYDQLLETGGGIKRALPLLGREPFWVLNGDIYSDIKLSKPVLDPDSLGHLILVPNPSYKKTGDFELFSGKICKSDEPNYTFSGMGFYRLQLFEKHSIGKFSLAPLLYEAAEKGRLSGSIYEGVWSDIGTPERLKDFI